MKHRSTNFELDNRVQYTKGLLAERLPRYEIIRKLKKHFNIHERQAVNYVSKAYEQWKQAEQNSRKELRLEQREALLKLYQVVRSEKQYSVCIQIEKLLAKIDGTQMDLNEAKEQKEPLTLVVRDYRATNSE